MLRHLLNDQVNEDDTDRAFSTHGGEEECISLGREVRREETSRKT
jgi:hypothetical protein